MAFTQQVGMPLKLVRKGVGAVASVRRPRYSLEAEDPSYFTKVSVVQLREREVCVWCSWAGGERVCMAQLERERVRVYGAVKEIMCMVQLNNLKKEERLIK